MNVNYQFPDDLHRALKIRAAEEGITLKALIIRLLSEGLVQWVLEDEALFSSDAGVMNDLEAKRAEGKDE
jgi:plasmid stability protein